MSYTPINKVRIVTAASLFDGHDAAINIMRRIMQSKGAEVIHLGHNRSAAEIVDCAIQEDAQGIAVTSYQGGHVEFFKYMYDLLQQKGCGHIKIFGGGGGTILPTEIEEMHAYGISRIYSPDDGRQMGLEGMIEDLIKQCDFLLPAINRNIETADAPLIARAITQAEHGQRIPQLQQKLAAAGVEEEEAENAHPVAVLGITGTGGAGKSSVTDELVRRFLYHYDDKTIAVISVDPSKKKTGGALLGDRIRMNSIHHPRAYMRSLATRESDKAISEHIQEAIDICKLAGFDFIILETSGIGQSDTAIVDYCDLSLYVMTPEYGAASQLEKINMLDYADVITINKFDKAGALDALHDVRKQYKRNHSLWNAKDDELPVVGTIASKFNNAGCNRLFDILMKVVEDKCGLRFSDAHKEGTGSGNLEDAIIPPSRVRYLAEIVSTIEDYGKWVKEQCAIASQWYKTEGVLALPEMQDNEALKAVNAHLQEQLNPECKN
ncbi:cobalamin-dependent protein [Chitinophaga sedimenti]|nr:cobalamin-dependent protein [Chitinophaga sedimenti]MCK7558133.1 cobalamin-dependent protein [Chitinophaga sedimenti]